MRWLPALALAELAELALAAPAPKPAGDGSGLLFGDITPTAVALVQAVKSSDPLFVDDTDVTPTPVVPVQAAESPAAFIADIANGASTAAAPAQVVQSPPAFVVEITDDTPTPVAQAQAAESSGPLLVDITDVTATAVDPAGSTPTRAPIPDHEILVIRPPTGGSANEDCGDGKPIFFNQDTWWAFGMNGRINDFWSKGIEAKGTDFDFHAEWAATYGSDLYCRTAADVCEGSGGVCSSLKGNTTFDKQIGLMGLRAIKNAQAIYVQMDDAIEQAANVVVGRLVEFSDLVLKQESLLGGTLKLLFNALIGLASTAVGAVGGTGGGAAAGLMSVASGIVSETLFGKDDENDPLKDFSDALGAWGKAQNMMHVGLNLTHSALFSNGDIGNGQTYGPEHQLPEWMWDGKMVDSKFSTQLFDTMAPAMTRLMGLRLAQSAFAARGGFFIYFNGTNPAKCKTLETKEADQDRICTDTAAVWPVMLTKDTHLITAIDGYADLKDWTGFNFETEDLTRSFIATYLAGGPNAASTAENYKTFVEKFKAGEKVDDLAGSFYLPVCHINAPYFWQPGLMVQKDKPACGCFDTDMNGKSIFDKGGLPEYAKKWFNDNKFQCV